MKKTFLTLFILFIAGTLSAQTQIINPFDAESDIDSTYWNLDRNTTATDENSHYNKSI
jgi:hypothetical protein